MTQWHYNDGGQQEGPISLDELKAKITAGELNRTSLVWQVGTKDWAAVQNFPELVEQVQTPPPLPKSVTIAASSRSFGAAAADALPALGISLFVVGIFLAIAIPQSSDNAGLIAISALVGLGIAIALVMSFRPKHDLAPPSQAWRRFFAKMLDVEIAVLAGLLAVAVISPESTQSFAAMFLSATLFVWFLFEVPMKGKSLGRYLFGVQLSPVADTEESPDFFARFLRLSFFGMALCMPIISAIASAFAYKRLRETGTTKWDDERFAVTYRKGVGLPLVGIFLLLVIAGAQGIINKLGPMKQAESRPVVEAAPPATPKDMEPRARGLNAEPPVLPSNANNPSGRMPEAAPKEPAKNNEELSAWASRLIGTWVPAKNLNPQAPPHVFDYYRYEKSGVGVASGRNETCRFSYWVRGNIMIRSQMVGGTTCENFEHGNYKIAWPELGQDDWLITTNLVTKRQFAFERQK